MGGKKLERVLPKSQHSERKLLNFEFWINGELYKIGHHFCNKKNLSLSKNVNKECAPKFSMKKSIRRIRMILA